MAKQSLYMTEEALKEFIVSSFFIFGEDEQYIFLGGLSKALGPEGSHIILEATNISPQQLIEYEKKLDDKRKEAGIL